MSCSGDRCSRGTVVPGRGDPASPFVVLGEAPGAQEIEVKQPFVGPSGKLIAQLAKEVGLDLSEAWITNSCKGGIAEEPNPTATQLKTCIAECLTPEIEAYPRKLILGLGNAAGYALGVLQKLSGITSARGKIVPSRFSNPDGTPIPCLLSVHPAAVLRAGGGEMQSLLKQDMAMAKEYLEEGKVSRKCPDVEIVPDEEFLKVFEDAEDTGWLALDVETDGLDPLAWDGKLVCLAASGGKGRAVVSFNNDAIIRIVYRAILGRGKFRIVGHNAKFDTKWLYRYAKAPTNLFTWDTMLAYSLLAEGELGNEDSGAQRKGLKFLLEARLGWPPYNDEIGAALKAGKVMSQLPWEQVAKYAALDVEGTVALARNLLPEIEEQKLTKTLEQLVMPISEFCAQVEIQPLYIDTDSLVEFSKRCEVKLIEVARQLREMSGNPDFNPASTKQVGDFLYRGLGAPVLQETESGEPSSKEAALKELLHPDAFGAYPKIGMYEAMRIRDFAKALLSYRQVSKLTSSFIEKLLEGISRDENGFYVTPGYRVDGTVTGRLCVDGDTLVDTDKGAVAIKTLDPCGEPVYVRTHKNRYRQVTALIMKGSEQMFRLTTEFGWCIDCTAAHRVLTPGGWMSVGDLKPGDLVKRVGYILQDDKVASIEPLGVREVWDISVEEDHSYTAQGLVHHNSSANPNIQQQPKSLRGLYLAKPGHIIIEADQSQAEVRFWAMYSGCPELQKLFRERACPKCGEVYDGTRTCPTCEVDTAPSDPYRMAAAVAFPGAEITKPIRDQVKTVFLGLMYGLGEANMAAKLGLSVEEARDLIDNLRNKFPKGFAWIDRQKQKILASPHEVRSMYGRVRRLRNYIASGDKELIAEAQRQATNAPIQGASSDMMLLNSIMSYEKMRDKKLDAFPIIFVHDSVAFSCAPGDAAEAIAILKQTLVESPVPEVMLDVEFKIGPRWGDIGALWSSLEVGDE